MSARDAYPESAHPEAEGLCAFIDASPSPFHACQTVARMLEDAGFSPLAERDPWPGPGRYFVLRGGSLIAFDSSGFEHGELPAFRIVGGHTDSPNLRVKQNHDRDSAGLAQVRLEPYGGAWLHSWLDRDLGISGRITVRQGDQVVRTLVRIDEPLLRVPQLAIHLSENRKGVEVDPQRHLDAVWGVGDPGRFLARIAAAEGYGAADVLGFELMVHDLTPSRLAGADGDLVSAPRLDNQCTCYAGTRALIDAADRPTGVLPVLALFDHEEVGSSSDRGAGSDFLITVLERIALTHGLDRQDFLRALAVSVCASGDMAHATHPNYPDRHEPGHRIAVNGGPVLKVNQNLRYASDADGEALFIVAAEQAGVPLQRYVHRADLPCGSTIGPITATRTGLTTVDVGAPQLAMHSARELMGAADVGLYVAALTAFLAPA